MKKEDLKDIPEEIILRAVELYLEAERTVSRWRSGEAEIPSYNMPDNLKFLLNCINDRAEFAALIDVMADEDSDFRIIRFPSRKMLMAASKRQAVYKYAKLKESGYDYSWAEIAELSGVGSITEARRYYEQAKESKANKSDGKKEKKLIDLTLKFLIQTVKIEKGYI